MTQSTDLYQRIGYPKEWLEDGDTYAAGDSYIRYDPAWDDPIEDIPRISIYELFKQTAERVPDEIAIDFLGKAVTYREFDLLINKFATLLLDLGVKKGDFIAPMIPTSLQHWITFFAAARIGAIQASLNVMYKGKEIAYQIKDCGAKTVIVLDMFYPYFKALKDDLGIENIIVTNLKDYVSPDFEVYPALQPFWDFPKNAIEGTIDFCEALEKCEPTSVVTECDPANDPAMVIYTSGTTGDPKGALETHLNLVHNTITHAHLLKFKEKPVNYSILPMNHTGGYMAFQLPTFYRGGTVVPRPLFDITDGLKAIQQHKVTSLFGPPTFYQALMMHPKFDEFDLSSLRMSTAGAAPVPMKLIEAWTAKTGSELKVGWGGTETNTLGTFNTLKNKSNPACVGVPFIGELKIINEQGKVQPRGEVGEMLFRGLQVSQGYLNKPEQTKAAFQADGWFKTGDAGYIDDDGFLHYVDRIKDLIIASGYNIAPVDVEMTIVQHPSVVEAGVIGVPDEYRGETVKAFVVLTDDAKGKVTEQDIKDFCKEKIAAFKVPTVVEFIELLPRNVLGKALRKDLKALESAKN